VLHFLHPFSLTLYGVHALFCYLIYSEGDMIFDLGIFFKEFLDFLLEFVFVAEVFKFMKIDLAFHTAQSNCELS
jgi:hypothetical protein